MRIVFVVHQFFPEFQSGTERVVLNLARMAQRAGHHVQVLACRVAHPEQFGRPSSLGPGARVGVVDGVPVTLLDRAALPGLSELAFEVDEAVAQAVERWLHAEAFELAHVLHPMRMASALLAIGRAKLPIVMTLTDFFLPCYRVNLVDVEDQHCPGPDSGERCARRCQVSPWTSASLVARHKVSKAILESAAIRVAPSAHVARQFAAAYPDLDFKVLAHGVDVVRILNPRPPVRALGVITLGFIGSIIPAKGLHILLGALNREPHLPLRLRVIGAHLGGKRYRDDVLALAADDARISFTGQCGAEQVAEEIAGMDLLCLPSLVPESFSLVLHECAARSVPCLSSDSGAPADVVRASGGGRVIEAGSVAAWADALRAVVADPDLLPQWRQRVSLPLRIEEEAFLYESLYRSAIDAR